MKSGLLVSSDAAPGMHREFTATELYALAKRLKEYGSVQPAYLCTKRAVELNPTDWDAWYDLGDLCQSVGRRDEARDAYQKYFDTHPDDAEIEHLLIALRDEAPPARASDRTIQQIYKDFAWNYETRMRVDLEYKGPERLSDAVRTIIPDPSGLKVLDLGCGSGLAGETLRPWARELTGLDLSPEMLDLARKRSIYDRLEVGEITQWLNQGSELFDLIASCDVVIYFGDVHELVAAARDRLKPGGLFAFSMERGQTYPFRITDTGRYEHHPDHIREAAAAAGMNVAYLEDAFLRMEYGSPVTGLFAVLKR
jgi:predicted TPR repeat methyltransferase